MNIANYESEGIDSELKVFIEKSLWCYAHFHPRIEVLYVTNGKIKVTINDYEKILSEDNIAISLSYDIHIYDKNPDSRQTLLMIPPEMVFDYYDFFENSRFNTSFLTDKDKARLIKPLIYKIIENKDEKYLAKGYTTALFGTLIKEIGLTDEQSHKNEPLLKRIIYYIEENYSEKITLVDLASHFGFSKNYMSHIFNTRVGTGFTTYINSVRLRHAYDDIKSHRGSITEICYRNGFGSLPSFYRCFKEAYGVSPKHI